MLSDSELHSALWSNHFLTLSTLAMYHRSVAYSLLDNTRRKSHGTRWVEEYKNATSRVTECPNVWKSSSALAEGLGVIIALWGEMFRGKASGPFVFAYESAVSRQTSVLETFINCKKQFLKESLI